MAETATTSARDTVRLLCMHHSPGYALVEQIAAPRQLQQLLWKLLQRTP